MIWQCSISVPRVHSIGHFESLEVRLRGLRAMPLLAVCRATRSMMQKLIFQQFKPLPYSDLDREGDYRCYNPSLDTIWLDLSDRDNLRDLVDLDIRSMGLPFSTSSNKAWQKVDEEVRHFGSLREIVVLLGRARADCDMELVYVDENSSEIVKRYPHDPHGKMGIREYVRQLRTKLASRHKKWVSYQGRRKKHGKSSPDWVLPEVKVAVLKALCTSTSPYSYVHRLPQMRTYQRSCLGETFIESGICASICLIL
jgi:hypothetical protein